jgi:GNAT superfamily N-acetyltransferase
MQLPKWRPIVAGDLHAIQEIADRIHVDLPERPEVFTDKINLFPQGCFALAGEGIVGYGISHPWMLTMIPPLDAFLGALPTHPDCIFVHDVVVLPEARGRGAAGRLIAMLADAARNSSIDFLALVSVYDTHPLWSKFGFHVSQDASLAPRLESYGDAARYTVRELTSDPP